MAQNHRMVRAAALVSLLALASGLAFGEEFSVQRPLALEVDSAGEIVFRSTDFQRPSAIDGDDNGRKVVAATNRNVVRIFKADGSVERDIQIPGPSDVEFLPGGHVLATSSVGVVREFDENGAVVWERLGLKQPQAADRLPNGNTLIAEKGAGRVIEVDRGGEIVWTFSSQPLMPMDVEALASGEVLIADGAAHRVLCVRRDGSYCWKLNHVGHPSALAMLPDGTGLVAAPQAGMVVHFDTSPRILETWQLGAAAQDIDFAADGDLLLALLPPNAQAAPYPFASDVAAEIVSTAARARVQQSSTNGKAKPQRRRNLVLVLFDSLRKDHLPFYGYWRNTAPAVDAIVGQSLVFDQYVAQASWTKPSMGSLFTSTYPTTHGAVHQDTNSRLADSLETLAEVLHGAGYYTAALMQNPHMGDRNTPKGFDQGFEVYEYYDPVKRKDELPGLLATRAIELLRDRPRDRPFFLTIFFLNPHYPYEPKEPHFGGLNGGPSNPGPINQYDGEIFEADAEVGRLLSGLTEEGLDDDTIFVFTTDHGEEFNDHGSIYHGRTLYDCVLDIPLVIRGLGKSGRFPGLVREIDLMPTFLDYLGVEPAQALRAQMAGTSIRKNLENGPPATGLVAYSETEYNDQINQIAKRTADTKVIADFVNNRVERYDLRGDHQEYNNLARDGDKGELATLRAWREALPRAAGETVKRELTESEREQLRNLGYDAK